MMTTHDMPQFAKLMTAIGELYSKSISKPLMGIYWQSLKRFTLSDVQKALQSHINHPDCGQFLPKPADVVRFIEGSGETNALQAWSKVEKAIRRIGSYRSLAFDDSIIHAVIEDMGGWVQLCQIKLHELPFRANEFQKRYVGFVAKSPRRYPKYLCGITEGENMSGGYNCEPPIAIGNTEKVNKVVTGGGAEPLLTHYLTQITRITKDPA